MYACMHGATALMMSVTDGGGHVHTQSAGTVYRI